MAYVTLRNLHSFVKNAVPALGICVTFVGIALFYGQMLTPNTSHELQRLISISNTYMP